MAGKKRLKLKPKICEMCRGEVPAGKNRIQMDGKKICQICYELELAKITDQIARARKRFERTTKQKINVGFDALFELFKNYCHTFTQIGEEVGGLTREGMRRIHKKYFSDISPLKPTGHIRQKVCARKRGIRLATETFRSLPELQPIIKEAEKRGYRVRPIMVNEPGVSRPCKSRLTINEHTCLVKKATRPYTVWVNNAYFRFQISHGLVKRNDFLIFQIEKLQPRFFVIPTRVPLSVSRERKRFCIFIPARKKAPYHNIFPEIDWWQYADAWHLLERREESQAVRKNLEVRPPNDPPI